MIWAFPFVLSRSGALFEDSIVFFPLGIASLMALFITFRDLAVDEQNFYYVRSSLIPGFSRSASYPISTIRSVSYTPLRGTLGESFYILLELSFVDGRSISYNLRMDKKAVEPIIHRLRLEVKKNPAKAQSMRMRYGQQ